MPDRSFFFPKSYGNFSLPPNVIFICGSELSNSELIIRAQIGSPGLVTGWLTFYQEEPLAEKTTTESHSAQVEEKLWRQAEQATRRELEKQKNKLKQSSSLEASAAISVITSHILALKDPVLQQQIQQKIHQEKLSAAKAVFEVFEEWIYSFKKLPDLLFQEKARDMEDIRHRLLARVKQQKNFFKQKLSEIIYTDSLLPSQLLRLARHGVKGVVIRRATPTSHELIIAKALNLPLLYHPEKELDIPPEGAPATLDANRGFVILYPKNAYQLAVKPWAKVTEKKIAIKNFKLYLNLSLPEELPPAVNVAGVGLFRSEVAFLEKTTIPTYEEQLTLYTQMMLPFKNQPFFFRLFDLTPDKQLATRPSSMGLRSIRYLLSEPALLTTQLQAIIAAQAKAKTKLTILVPFVSQTEELLAVKQLLTKLSKTPIRLAAMIENPAALAMLPFWNHLVAAYNVGTSDLLQFLTATRRNDYELIHYLDPLQEANLSALQQILKKATKPVIVCGELVSQPGWLELLLAMGYRQFSASSNTLPALLNRAAQVNLVKSKKILQEIRKAPQLKERHALFKQLQN